MVQFRLVDDSENFFNSVLPSLSFESVEIRGHMGAYNYIGC